MIIDAEWMAGFVASSVPNKTDNGRHVGDKRGNVHWSRRRGGVWVMTAYGDAGFNHATPAELADWSARPGYVPDRWVPCADEDEAIRLAAWRWANCQAARAAANWPVDVLGQPMPVCSDCGQPAPYAWQTQPLCPHCHYSRVDGTYVAQPQ